MYVYTNPQAGLMQTRDLAKLFMQLHALTSAVGNHLVSRLSLQFECGVTAVVGYNESLTLFRNQLRLRPKFLSIHSPLDIFLFLVKNVVETCRILSGKSNVQCVWRQATKDSAVELRL
jgi:hypothetical protein